MTNSGQCGEFHWLVASSLPIAWLVEAMVRSHARARLCITALDSAPTSPGPEEQAKGWFLRGNIMVSPPLGEGLDIPNHEYDEWYLLDDPPPADWNPEVFVNYGGFTLASVAATDVSFDLQPIQERFWEQIERINPISYIARGDHDLVVSRRSKFIEQLRVKK